MRRPSPVWRFALLVLLLVGPCFAVWYWLAPWYDRPAAWLAQWLVRLAGADVLQSVAFDDRAVAFVTTLETRAASGERGLLTFEVNPLLYTYGAPLLVALMVASRASLSRLLLGLALLLPFQAWGIAFDFLAQVVRSGPALASQAGLVGLRAEAVALAYQLGSLVLPAAAPVVVWAMLRADYVRGLVGNSASVAS